MPITLIWRTWAESARLLTWRDARNWDRVESARFRRLSDTAVGRDIMILNARCPNNDHMKIGFQKINANRAPAATPAKIKLVGALRSINEISPASYRFVRNYTDTILLCRSEGTHFHSASVSRHPKLTVLYNLKRTVPAPILIDAIVHEAIHGFIFAVMQHRPIVVNPTHNAGITCISPWTGAFLPVSAFCHACLVWFGLAHFWEAAVAQGSFGRMARKLHLRAASGFLHDPIGGLLANYGPLIAPPVARLLADAACIGVTTIQPQT
jgi:HEXXH motif-containing protein